MSEPLNIRGPIARDKPYLLSSWHHSLYDFGVAEKQLPKPVYDYHMARITDHHWDESQWLVLSGDSVNDWVAGFVCGLHTEGATHIHYVYVREKYRRHGWGRHLVSEFLGLADDEDDEQLVYYSCNTVDSRGWARGRRKRGMQYLGRQWMYNPYGLTYRMPPDWYVR